MLIGSEKTPQFTFLASSIKFTSGVITPAATLIGEEVFVNRNHADSSKARSVQVLRNSPRAMPLPGYELVRPEITCDKSALLCFH